jgi:hypothetical protein
MMASRSASCCAGVSLLTSNPPVLASGAAGGDACAAGLGDGWGAAKAAIGIANASASSPVVIPELFISNSR